MTTQVKKQDRARAVLKVSTLKLSTPGTLKESQGTTCAKTVGRDCHVLGRLRTVLWLTLLSEAQLDKHCMPGVGVHLLTTQLTTVK